MPGNKSNLRIKPPLLGNNGVMSDRITDMDVLKEQKNDDATVEISRTQDGDSQYATEPDTARNTQERAENPSSEKEERKIVDEKYEIQSVIGRGGMGIVYRVRHLFLNKDFALKTLDNSEAGDLKLRRFQQEAQAASKLEHPNLVKVRDFGFVDNDKPFLVMDLISGVTLSAYLKKNGPLPVELAVPLFIQVCFGLYYAHSQGVVHRDIKPGNIIWLNPGEVTAEGDVKIVDFGIAKVSTSDDYQALTRTGDLFGSPLYMSPEQCKGIAVDQRSDIYSLGCVFYEVLTGLPPFVCDTALATMMKHQSESVPTLKEGSFGRDFPQGLEHIVARMLAKEPPDRYQSMADVVLDLTSLSHVSDLAGRRRPELKRSEAKISPEAGTLKGSSPARWILPVAGSALVGAVTGILIFKEVAAPAVPSPPPRTVARTSEFEGISEKRLPSSRRYETNGLQQSKWDTLTLNFPARSWGTIDAVAMDNLSWNAVGDITVPANLRLRWNVMPELGSDPQVFRQFRGDEFVSIHFADDLSVNDTTVKAICQKFSALRSLMAPRSSISDQSIDELNRLDYLRALNISDTHITENGLLRLKTLPLFTDLAFGSLVMSTTTPVLKKLAHSPHMVHLLIHYGNLSDDDTALIASMSNLEQLRLLDASSISARGVRNLAKLKRLERLEIYSAHLRPDCIPEFAKMKSLKSLNADFSRKAKRHHSSIIPTS